MKLIPNEQALKNGIEYKVLWAIIHEFNITNDTTDHSVLVHDRSELRSTHLFPNDKTLTCQERVHSPNHQICPSGGHG